MRRPRAGRLMPAAGFLGNDYTGQGDMGDVLTEALARALQHAPDLETKSA
jgi:hypothetical protein